MLGIAIVIDTLAGELPNRLHPVVWIGHLVAAFERRAPRRPRAQLLYGAVMATAVPLVAGFTAFMAERIARRLPLLLRVLALGLILKPAFAIRALIAATAGVEDDMARNDLVAVRTSIAALVSRDASSLDEQLAAAAAIESIAENLTDSIVAPLLAYAVAGLPGAYWYRAVNTLDSMVGYRGRYEWLGKASARLDDAINCVPARMAALLLIASSAPGGGSIAGARRGALADHDKTESPNAGWTMAAMAGALNIRLEKQGHYLLNRAARLPEPADIRTARRIVTLAAAAAGFLTAAAIALRCRTGRR